MAELEHQTDFLVSKAIVNVQLSEPKTVGMNGSVLVFKDEALAKRAAELMGRKGPGDVDVEPVTYTFKRQGGGEITLHGVSYDNVKRDAANQHKHPTPAEVIEAAKPSISVVAKRADEAAVRQAVGEFIVQQSLKKG